MHLIKLVDYSHNKTYYVNEDNVASIKIMGAGSFNLTVDGVERPVAATEVRVELVTGNGITTYTQRLGKFLEMFGHVSES